MLSAPTRLLESSDCLKGAEVGNNEEMCCSLVSAVSEIIEIQTLAWLCRRNRWCDAQLNYIE